MGFGFTVPLIGLALNGPPIILSGAVKTALLSNDRRRKKRCVTMKEKEESKEKLVNLRD